MNFINILECKARCKLRTYFLKYRILDGTPRKEKMKGRSEFYKFSIANVFIITKSRISDFYNHGKNVPIINRYGAVFLDTSVNKTSD